MRLFFAGLLNHIVVMFLSPSCMIFVRPACEFWGCSQCLLSKFRHAAIFCDSISWCLLEWWNSETFTIFSENMYLKALIEKIFLRKASLCLVSQNGFFKLLSKLEGHTDPSFHINYSILDLVL